VKEIILQRFVESARVKVEFAERSAEAVMAAVEMIAEAFRSGRKILLFIAAEFVNRFEMERPGLPAIALTTDTSALTSIANDYAFGEVFARQVRALGAEGDVAVAISTSGASPNVIQGVQAAKEISMQVIAFSGRDGGQLAELSDIALVIPSDSVAHIQESHITLGHVICELVDQKLYGPDLR
jgi:D-sedoheptulose 7-phosphate isomerase